MYFKDRPNRNISYEHPRNVSSVRPPLVPDGFHGDTGEVVESVPLTWREVISDPWFIAGLIVVILLLWWLFSGKKEKYSHQY